MANQNGALVELRRVSQRYQTRERMFTALHEIDLVVREGEFVALLGPSGCGKSTLLRIITGLQAPSDGQVLYRGSPLRGINAHAAIVFQTMALFPWLTVQQNVEIALKVRGVPPAERSTRAVALLDKVGLDGFESAYPRELSGGMRQKVGFARAMAVEPELLCLDEPFSALDVLSAEALRAELLELWTSGAIPTRAILMVTHNIEEAIFLADRVIVMEKDPGRVVSELSVTLPHPRHRRSAEFTAMVDRVYGLLAGQTQPEHVELGTAPGEPGRTRALPHITINDLSGLLEYLAGLPRPEADLYRVAAELKIDSDYLLRLAEAAELLGLATISRGDITLTPLGETFADATILARKEIFGSRMRRIPIYRWLAALLAAADRRQLKAGVVQRALEIEFPPAESTRQLDTLVGWGRYAELLSYDDGSETITLESAAGATSGDGVTPSSPPPRPGSTVTSGAEPGTSVRATVTNRASRCELFDAADRRFRDPFVNWTNCEPRFTIIRDVPLRPSDDDHGLVHHVSGVRCRAPEPARLPLPCRAGGVRSVRAAPRAAGRAGRARSARVRSRVRYA